MRQDTPEVILVRVFNAPRPLVFRAWTDARFLVEWWHQQGIATRFVRLIPVLVAASIS